MQDRDLSLLSALFEARVMTSAHAASLFFAGSKEATKKRLQKLKAAHLIGDRMRKPYEPSILFLTRQGYDLLQANGVLDAYPRIDRASVERRAHVSELTLRHELEVMDVRTAFHSAIATSGRFKLVEFSTWPLLYQFQASRSDGRGDVIVKPDGFIRIEQEENDGGASIHTYFLEVDRSSETQETLVTRAGCYLDYYRSGGFAVRNGADRAVFKDYPFRVLMVFKSAERRNNTAERLLSHNPPIFSQVCLSTLLEVTADPLGPIWLTPLDYREAVKGTPFDTDLPRPSFGYRRQSEREALVEARVRKFKVLET